jgi:hypothetical protein
MANVQREKPWILGNLFNGDAALWVGLNNLANYTASWLFTKKPKCRKKA